MIKKHLYILFLIAFAIGCTKENNMPTLVSKGMADVSRVEIFPNSEVLIGNGDAQLNFTVKAYTKLTDTTDTEMLLDRFNANDIKIYSSTGNQVVYQQPYTTTTTSNTTQKFYAQIGNIKSTEKTVNIVVAEDPNFTSITIPVIFHVENTTLTQEYVAAVTTNMLQNEIDNLNNIFAANLFKAPSSINTKIKFELAAKTPAGIALGQKGINVFNKPDTVKTEAQYNNYVKANVSWDYSKYLNIWLINPTNTTNNNSNTAVLRALVSSCKPKYIINKEATTIPGLNLSKIVSVAAVANILPNMYGLYLPIKNIANMRLNSFSDFGNFPRSIGLYFGLMATGFNNGGTVPNLVNNDFDYCSDTYSYKMTNISVNKESFLSPKYYYTSFNIMDEYSASNTISYQQALRLRNVVQNCAFRQFQ